jgi:hypothetical protein
MLERVQDGPAQTVALRASGAIEAQDVEAAINAAVGEAATGLVVIIAPDFGGDFAELARGLATSALAHKALVKLAVVVDAEQMDGARLNSFEASPVSNGRPRLGEGSRAVLVRDEADEVQSIGLSRLVVNFGFCPTDTNSHAVD